MSHQAYASLGFMPLRDSLHEAQTFIHGEGYESFSVNRTVQNPVMRSLEVVGEAARRISADLCEAYPDVPRRLVGDSRKNLVHDYWGSNLEVIWQTATKIPRSPP